MQSSFIRLFVCLFAFEPLQLPTKRLSYKNIFLDSMPVNERNNGSYCGQRHRRCFYEAMKKLNFFVHKGKEKQKTK